MCEKISKCCSCGYEWPTGSHGGHSCSQVLRQKINILENEKINLINIINDLLEQIESCNGTAQINVDSAKKLINKNQEL